MSDKEKIVRGIFHFCKEHAGGILTLVAIVVTFMMTDSYICGYENGAQDVTDYIVVIVVTFMMIDSYMCGYENGAQDVTDYILEHPDILNDKEN